MAMRVHWASISLVLLWWATTGADEPSAAPSGVPTAGPTAGPTASSAPTKLPSSAPTGLPTEPIYIEPTVTNDDFCYKITWGFR